MNDNKTALFILAAIFVIAVAGLVFTFVEDNKSTGLAGHYYGYGHGYGFPAKKIYGGAIDRWNAEHSYMSYDSLFDENGKLIIPAEFDDKRI